MRGEGEGGEEGGRDEEGERWKTKVVVECGRWKGEQGREGWKKGERKREGGREGGRDGRKEEGGGREDQT